jgi:hypothetical protein
MHDSNDIHHSAMREPQVIAINYIEKTFNQIIKNIHIRPCGHPSIVLKRIAHVKSPGSDNGWKVADRQTKISFPGKNKDEAWRFGKFRTLFEARKLTLPRSVRWQAFIRDLHCAQDWPSRHKAVPFTNQTCCTILRNLRDIYYRDPELFRSQSVVDRYVDVVAYTCGVTRIDLNVVGTSMLYDRR